MKCRNHKFLVPFYGYCPVMENGLFRIKICGHRTTGRHKALLSKKKTDLGTKPDLEKTEWKASPDGALSTPSFAPK